MRRDFYPGERDVDLAVGVQLAEGDFSARQFGFQGRTRELFGRALDNG